MVTDIQINTNNGQGSYTSGGAGGGKQATVNVSKDEPWDPLSKAFKKYTHTIDYPRSGNIRLGNTWDYNIKVVGSRTSGGNTFMYKEPREWVHEVEVYFWADASPSNMAPLIVGFVSRNWSHSNIQLASKGTKGCPISTGRTGSKCYYTWSYLTTKREFDGQIDPDNAISEKDLINGLLEELGKSSSVRGRDNKLVINLNQKPNGTEFKYPGSGPNQKKITVRKETVEGGLRGYDRYVHSTLSDDEVSDTGEFSEFYVSYKNNSRFFKTDNESGSDRYLWSVDAYFESGSEKLVLITFTLSSGSEHEYKYYDFVNDLKGLKDASTWADDVKTIITGGLGGLTTIDVHAGDGSDLRNRLQGESERLRPLMAFVKGDRDGTGHKNITTTEELVSGQGDGGTTFKKVTLNPDTSDKGGGFAVGPWNVYNSKLFTGREQGKKIEPESVLTSNSIFTGDTSQSSSKKYNAITVYYSTKGGSVYKALLVEFDQAGTIGSTSSSSKTYIKRLNEDGTEWATETISGSVVVTADKLAKIAKGASQENKLSPLIEFRSGDTGTGKNENVTTSQPSNIGQEGGYKFMKVTMKPDTSDLGEGSSSGPWTVYINKLFDHEQGAKFDESVLRDITTTVADSRSKYSSITIYYAVTGSGNRDHSALLVEFVPGVCGRKKYIRRKNRNGNEWESTTATGIGIGVGTGTASDSNMLHILKKESKKLMPLIAFVQDAGSSKNENIRTKQHNVGDGNKFIKVVMTPNISDRPDVLGSSGGPWKVYSNELFTYEQDPIIDDGVLSSFFTTVDASGTSSGSKYQSITVYYFLKNRSDYMALLVEFCPGDGSRKYIKIDKGSNGSKWANADDIDSTGGEMTTEVLNKIARDAKIIGSNVIITEVAAQPKEIQIDSNGTDSRGYGGYVSKVTKDEPWDKLSKIFKRYTHTIGYPEDRYDESKYNITMYSKNSGGPGGSGFTLNTPTTRVDAVEVFFRFTDVVKSNNPLIVGFVYATSSKSCTSGCSTSGSGCNICYYTWANLANRQYDCTITADSISDKDLVTVLLQIGSTVTYRKNKLVIRLDEQPTSGSSTYPGSGHYKNKITVSKHKGCITDFQGFDKYVHTFSGIGAGAPSPRRGGGSPGVGSDKITATQQKEIQINTYETGGHYTSGRAGVTVKVTPENPWDKLSRAFKKYTHTIQYPGDEGGYLPSNYVRVNGPSGSSNNKFTLTNPNPQVKAVEMFFKAGDRSGKDAPLVVGFVYGDGDNSDSTISSRTGCGSNKCYYAWNKLKTTNTYSGTIGAESFGEKDLIQGLLEELARTVPSLSSRQNKLVIRLGEKPPNVGGGGDEFKYPATGFYKDSRKQVTVTKVAENTGAFAGLTGYDGYEHTFTGAGNVSDLYVTYENNSRYFNTGSRDAKIQKVTAYFETGGDKRLVFITFNLTGRGIRDGKLYWYSYHTFVNDLKKVKAERATAEETFKLIIGYGGLPTVDHGGSALKNKLQGEIERLKPFIEFKQGGRTGGSNDTGDNENIKTMQEKVGQGYTFQKVTMTPRKTDNDVPGGISVGPWRVYNNFLLGYEKDAKISGDVLAGFFTTDVTRIDSTKYSSITVYYFLKNGIDYKALLVKFDPGSSGGKKYFKRTNKEGSEWSEETGIKTSPDGELAKTLTDIANEAQIIGSSYKITDKMATVIDIETDKTTGSYFSDVAGVTVKVTKDEPWDKLSKIFKRYTHTIEYPEDRYDESNYNITVYSKNSGGPFGSGFTYEKPTVTVKAVQVFFRFTDFSNKAPLVVGFIDVGNSKKYYTWAKLTTTSNREFIGDIDGVDSISDKDLINGLLQELGTSVLGRKNKLVIRLDEKPTDDVGREGFKYPGSGHYSCKITVKKVTNAGGDTGFDKYDRYVHTVPGDTGGVRVEEFYVSYKENSRYIQASSKVVSGRIDKVAVYYEKGAGTSAGNFTSRPVLFVFSFTGRAGKLYAYTYYDFVSELKKVSTATATITVKVIDKLTRIDVVGDGSGLLRILQQESERLKQIEFVTDGDSTSTTDVSIKQEEKYLEGQENVEVEGNKFKKVTMKPDTSKNGPWKVCNSQLFSLELGKKIEGENVLTRIATSSSGNKYHFITVYYSPEGRSSDGGDSSIKHMALLVVFDDYGSKTYIKRENEGGTKWAKVDARDIGIRGSGDGDAELVQALTQIRDASFGTVSREAVINTVSRGGGGSSYGGSNVGGSNSVITPVSVGPTVSSHGSPIGESGTGRRGGGNTNGSDGTGAGGIEECYVTYERNSRYFMTATKARVCSCPGLRQSRVGSRVWSCPGLRQARGGSKEVSWLYDDKIMTVDAYYEKGTTTGTTTRSNNSKRLVLIVFSLKSGSTYVYPYSDFIKELNDERSENKIIETELKTIDGSSGRLELQRILQQESERLKQIEFVTDGDSTSTTDVSIKQEEKYLEGQENVEVEGNKFKKVTMKPDTSKNGPWKVCNSQLFSLELGKKIEGENVLTRIATSSSGNKYHFITVYYSPEGISSSSSSDDDGGSSRSGSIKYKYMALLVKFDDYGRETYIRRLNEQGTKWDITTADSIGILTGNDTELLPKLHQQREKMRPLISLKSGGSRGNKHIKTEGPVPVEGQGTVGPGEDYKFQKVTMTANTSDTKGGGGSSKGPWTVHSDKLFTDGSGKKIEEGVNIPEDVLKDIITGDITSSVSRSSKYRTISIYYAMTDDCESEIDIDCLCEYSALLVEFVSGGCGIKTYIKRKGVGGTSWKSVPGIGIGVGTGGKVTVQALTEIAKTAGIMVASKPTAASSSVAGSRSVHVEQQQQESQVQEQHVEQQQQESQVQEQHVEQQQQESQVQEQHVEQQQQENRVHRDRGESSGQPTGHETAGVESSSSNSGGSNGNGLGARGDSTANANSSQGNSDDSGAANGSSDGSDATIGGAVGGGVSLIVASGGTGFGIYRYRHVFLSLIGK